MAFADEGRQPEENIHPAVGRLSGIDYQPLLESAAQVIGERLGVAIVPVSAPAPSLAGARRYEITAVAVIAPDIELVVHCGREALWAAAALTGMSSWEAAVEGWAQLWSEIARNWCERAYVHSEAAPGQTTVRLTECAEVHSPRFVGGSICHFDLLGETVCASVRTER